jgi:hypothetical protein
MHGAPVLPVRGGCLCGAIRYRVSTSPIEGSLCHCRNCRKSSGSVFQASVQFVRSEFQFSRGEPSYYKATPFARRGFCPNCGSPLVFEYEGTREVWVPIGSLDHPENWPLVKDANWGETIHYHIDSKISWLNIEDGLHQCSAEHTPFRDKAARFPLD